MSRQLTIEVFFDFVCPWCLIGKRQLQRALTQLQSSHPTLEVTLRWRGVQLLPQIPAAGEPFTEFYLQRLGSPQAVSARQAQVREAASAAGVSIDFSTIKKMPNTRKAHELFAQALAVGTPEECEQLLERLFAGYFNNSEDLSDPAVLQQISTSCGFSSARLAGVSEQSFVSADTAGNGVPYFVFGERLALSGAHPAETLYQAMLQALSSQEQQS